MIVPEVLDFKYDQQEIWNAHNPPQWSGEEALVVDSGGVSYSPVTLDATSEEQESGSFVTDPPTEKPTGIKLIGVPLTVGAAFSWNQLPGVDGYRIYRSLSEDTLGVPLDDLNKNELSFKDTTSLVAGQDYFIS